MPVRKARQLCDFHSVALAISSRVAPFPRDRRRVTVANFVRGFVEVAMVGLLAAGAGLRRLALTQAAEPQVERPHSLLWPTAMLALRHQSSRKKRWPKAAT